MEIKKKEDLYKGLDIKHVPYKDARWSFPIHSEYVEKCIFELLGKKKWKRMFCILDASGDLFFFEDEKSKYPVSSAFVRGRFFSDEVNKSGNEKIIYIDQAKSRVIMKIFGMISAIDRWIEMISKAGGIYINGMSNFICHEVKYLGYLDSPKKNLPSICIKDLARWNQMDVIKWLSLEKFEKKIFFSKYKKEFNKNYVTGKILDKYMNEKLLKSIGVNDVIHRMKIMRKIKELRLIRVFKMRDKSLDYKFKELKKKFPELKDQELDYVTNALTNPALIQNTYLSHPSKNRKKILEEIPGKYKKIKKLEITEHIIGGSDFRRIPQPKMRICLKTVVIEWPKVSNFSCAKNYFDPLLCEFPTNGKTLGEITVGVVLGPWLLVWEESCLCIPRKIEGSYSLYLSNYNKISLIKEISISSIIEKLSSLVVKWNKEMHFSKKPSSCKNKGNCLDFVKDVYESFEISMNLNGAWGEFFRNYNLGNRSFDFFPCKRFVEQFNLKKSKYTFESHIQLDNFCKNCIEIDQIAFELDYKEEINVLECFDRIFWFRHLYFPNVEKYKPSYNCFFGSIKNGRQTDIFI